jgi:hypothetical protein
MARFACGSMVLDLSFHKKIHKVNFFVKKSEISTLPEAISPAKYGIA